MQQELSKTKAGKIKGLLKSDLVPIIIIFLVFFIGLSILSDKFLTLNNMLNVLRQISITFVAAVGMTIVVIAGGVDISIGSVLAVVGVFSAAALKDWGAPVGVAIVFGILLGGLLGLINGVLIIKTKVQPIIITLATMQAYRAFPYLYTNAQPIVGLSDDYKFIGQGYIGPIPFPVIIMAAVFIVGYVVLSKTQFGTRLYVIGSNENAARLTGIKVTKYKLATYVILGLLSGLAGVMLTARIGSGVASTGDGFEFDTLTAVLIGGVSLNGGKGNMIGTLFGCLIMGILSNGLNILNVSSYLQMLIMGCMLILAVSVDSLAKERRN